MLFIYYPACSTCIKAKKYLDTINIEYRERNIKLDNPTYEELLLWYRESDLDVKNFFNTSGNLYKELNLKDKLKTMTEDEKLKLLSTNGMLVKRPILVLDNKILVGFKQEKWEEALK